MGKSGRTKINQNDKRVHCALGLNKKAVTPGATELNKTKENEHTE